MAKRFIIDCPEQLREIESRKILKEGSLVNLARVWRIAQHQGKDTWNGKIGVCFMTEGRERVASVYRRKSNGDDVIIARLKYNPALEWCRENLMEAKHE